MFLHYFVSGDDNYRIYSAIRRGFPSLEWVQIIKSVLCNVAVIRVLPFLNNPKDLDPSDKADLDFWDCFGRKKTPSYKPRNTVRGSVWAFWQGKSQCKKSSVLLWNWELTPLRRDAEWKWLSFFPGKVYYSPQFSTFMLVHSQHVYHNLSSLSHILRSKYLIICYLLQRGIYFPFSKKFWYDLTYQTNS